MVCADFGQVDWGCNEEFTATVPDEVVSFAEQLAVGVLHALSGYAVGACPTKLRPCIRRYSEGNGWNAWNPRGGGQWVPYITHGQWVNACGCGPSGCACTDLRAIELPPPVGEVVEVKVDGVVLDPSEYVLYGNKLLRREGSWPVRQNLRLPDTEEGTYSVTYVQGTPADDVSRYVAGLLAYEFAQACQGNECDLPSGVSTVVRPGVTVEIVNGLFPEGRTGIPAVDAWIRTHNPLGRAVQGMQIRSPRHKGYVRES